MRFAVALVSNPELLVLDEPTVAMDVEGRRSFWTTMRELAARGKTVLFATHYLEEADAYADRAVLMAHGRIVADGPPTEIRAMVGTRTIRATLPGADLAALAAPARRQRRRAPRRGGGAELRGLRRRDPRAAGRAQPEARDIEIAAAGLEQAFLELTAPSRGRHGAVNALPYTRYELLRTLRNRRFFFLSLGFPLVLYFLIAGPQRNDQNFGGRVSRSPLYYMVGMVVVRDDERDALERRADRGRARGRLEPPAAHQPALDARLLPRQGAHGVHDGAAEHPRAVRLPASRSGSACRRRSGWR